MVFEKGNKIWFGRHHTDEAKKKISLANKGKIYGFKGRHHTEETKMKLSLSHKGKKLSKEHKRKISLANKGHLCWCRGLTKETNKILKERSLKFSGKNAPFYGRHHSEKAKLKIKNAEINFYKTHSHARLGMSNSLEHNKKIRIAKLGEKNPNWKGNNVTKEAGWQRARYWYNIPEPCKNCGSKSVEHHHKDGNSLNNKPENIEWSCRRCHMITDGRMFKRDKNGRFK